MEVWLADHAGFCYGVQRALRLTEEAVEKERAPCFTLGALVHNPGVVARLAEQGVRPVEDPAAAAGGVLVIRSHGAGPDVYRQAGEMGVRLYDATCPHVRRVQREARRMCQRGLQVVILGDAGHPEVEAVRAWTDGRALVVGSAAEARELPPLERAGLVAQTTQPPEALAAVAAVLREKAAYLEVRDTICHATRERQEAACALAERVDVMLVVGGRESANTGKLTRLCAATGTPTYQVEGAAEIDPGWFRGARKVGVTAGASTPDWIIEEVVHRMEELERNEEEVVRTGEEAGGQPAGEVEVAAPAEESPAPAVAEKDNAEAERREVESQMAQEIRGLRKGEIVTGTVIQVNPDEVLVDVGGKSEGIIPRSELSYRDVDPAEAVQVGQQIDVFVLRLENEEGHPVLSKKRADRKQAWDRLERLFQEKAEIKAPVVEVVKGGLLVGLGGVNGFVPASLVERGYVENLEAYLGKELALRIIELDRAKNKVVLSRKAILEEEYEKKRAETWATLEEGQVRHGVVRRLTNFGAFVDIGGVDGLLHVSELSWGRVDHPRSVLTEGQELDVKVLGVDREQGKVSLGLKQLLPNPWYTAEEKYPPGSVVQGKVLRIAPFGAFVEVEPGVEGLVHISQLADRHVEKTEDVVSPGDVIPVKVLSVDGRAQRMSLSLRQAQGHGGRVERRQNSPAPEPRAEQAEDTSGVKLGDLFGDLFEERKDE